MRAVRNPVLDIYFVTRNRPWYLFATLDALDKYTTVPRRIFVADNASSKKNDTALILQRFLKNRRAINGTVRFKTNRVSARDDLIKKFKPKAKYMVIMDDDFLVPKGWAESMIAFIEEHPEFAVLSLMPDDVDHPDPKNKLTPSGWKYRQLLAIRKINEGDIWRTNVVEGLMFTTREHFKRIGKFVRGRIYSRALTKRGFKVGYMKEPVVRHIGYNMWYDYPGWQPGKVSYFRQFRDR